MTWLTVTLGHRENVHLFRRPSFSMQQSYRRLQHIPPPVYPQTGQDGHIHDLPHPPQRLRLLCHLILWGDFIFYLQSFNDFLQRELAATDLFTVATARLTSGDLWFKNYPYDQLATTCFCKSPLMLRIISAILFCCLTRNMIIDMQDTWYSRQIAPPPLIPWMHFL